MKVKELMEKLSKLNPESMVVVCGYEGGVEEVNEIQPYSIALNYSSEWYYGKHQIISKNILDDVKDRNLSVVDAVYLSS